MNYTAILQELSTYTAVSGYEEKLAGRLAEILSEYCDSVEVDSFFNVIALKKGQGGSPKRFMVTSHYDEVGLLVKAIDENGFVKVVSIGGIDTKVLLAQEVIIHGREDVPGFIGAKPPHLLKPDETKKAVKFCDIYIDTGMSVENVRKLIMIGDVITIKVKATALKGDKVTGKAMDNRISMVSMLEAAQRLSMMKHQSDVYFVATTQEECSGIGAISASYNLRPDVAIVIDACHGEIAEASKEDTYPLGKGPAIGIGPNMHTKLTKKLFDAAKDENIPYQTDIEAGDSGTEAWLTQISREGIPTVLISTAVKYMHTPVEIVNAEDVKNAGRLAAAFIVKAEKELEGLLCY